MFHNLVFYHKFSTNINIDFLHEDERQILHVSCQTSKQINNKVV